MFWGAILRLCNRVNTRGITSDSVKLISNRQHLLSVTAKVSNQPFKQAGSFTQILFIALSRFTSGSINRYFFCSLKSRVVATSASVRWSCEPN
nr:hypothetical protein [Escherichia coli]